MADDDWHGLFAARIGHLIDGRHIGVECTKCGHLAELMVNEATITQCGRTEFAVHDDVIVIAAGNRLCESLTLSETNIACSACGFACQVEITIGDALSEAFLFGD